MFFWGCLHSLEGEQDSRGGEGKLPALGWDADLAGGSMLLAAKPGGEDFPSGKGVFKACRSLLSHFLSPE